MADVRSTTPYFELEKFSRGHPVRDVDIGENMDIIDTAMELNRVAVTDASTAGAGYWFDGADDDVTVTDDANTDFGAYDDFYIEMSIMPLDVTRTTDYLINKEAGGIGYGLYINQDDLYIRIDDNTVDASAIIGTAVFSNNVKAKILVSFDRDGDATAYVDGELVGTVDISAVTATLASAGNLHVGNDSAGTNEFYGEIYLARVGSITQTESEALALSNGSPIPYKYLGASQTLITPSDDCSGDNVANWTDVNGALVHSASIYTYTVTDGTLVATFTDEAELVVGKMYRASVEAKDGTGTGSTVRINALTNAGVVIENGASITVATANAVAVVEWMATETNNKVQIEIVAGSVADGETVIFDTIECNSVGCTMQLDPDGVGVTQWTDNSGNAVSGVVTGATAINVPSSQGGVRNVSGALVGAASGSYAFTWQNPEAVEVLVQRVIIDVTTHATEATSQVDIDVVSGADQTGTGIFDTLVVGTTTGVYDHLLVAGTGAGGVHKMDEKGGSNDWITSKVKTASAANLVGKYYIEYILV